MSTRTSPAPVQVPGAPVVPAAAPGAGRAVGRLALRQVRRSGLATLLVALALTATVAASFDALVADPATLTGLLAVAQNPAVRTLFGEPVALETAGGFTVWRSGTPVAVLVGAWAALATARTTRGQEEAGRWNLLLAGPVRLRTAVGRHLLAVAAVVTATGAAVAAALLLAGTPAAGAAVHGAGIAALGLFSAAVAALAAQVLGTRSAATGAAVAALGAGLLTRSVADGVPGWQGLRWASPFGLLELSRPYAQDRVLPVLLLLAAAAALAAVALVLAGRRDVGSGLLARPAHRRARTALLGSVEGFAVRRALRPLAGWSTGIGAYYLLIGTTAVALTEFLTRDAAVSDLAGQAGFAALDSVRGFAATVFSLLPVPVGVFAAVRIAALVSAEPDRRLALLAAGPVGRVRLLGTEAAVSAAGLLALLTVAGFATWAGVAASGGGLTLPEALRGTWSTAPVALLCLGAAVLAAGWLPSATALVGSLPAVGGFLLQVLADSTGAPAWVREVSPFAHLALVPLEPAGTAAALVMTLVAVLLAVVGAAGYRRRDLLC
ncbi:polyketide antibiotic transporter [Kineococcus esterisolvens]|uniref:polyketide antibiotic transporter n=1 Tax=unclassified Kineococcus TaxID=2621656 RepID=UPI003D7E62C7